MAYFYKYEYTNNRKNIHPLRQNSVCLGLKFSSESKLFGGCHPCSRATSATLVMTFSNLLHISIIGIFSAVQDQFNWKILVETIFDKLNI